MLPVLLVLLVLLLLLVVVMVLVVLQLQHEHCWKAPLVQCCSLQHSQLAVAAEPGSQRASEEQQSGRKHIR
jgi:hypothetical protein